MTSLERHAAYRDPMDDPVDHPLLGRRVTVILDHDDPAAQLTGTLVALTVSGDVTVDTDAGRRYGWPALGIAEATDV